MVHLEDHNFSYDVIVIGGGAAGFFTALECSLNLPSLKIAILEATNTVLTKVKISGGGRCNVTHHEFNPKNLIKNYPRGSKELLGPFHHFGPQQTVQWFARQGVHLKIEKDGRMFPETNSSQTIIDCFTKLTENSSIEVRKNTAVKSLVKKNESGFLVTTRQGEILGAPIVVLATGSSPGGHLLAASLGHQVIDPVPSLFTFKIEDPSLLALAGVSIGAPLNPQLSLTFDEPTETKKEEFSAQGPLMVTHWGLSGPGILRLSAFSARELFTHGYRAHLKVNWTSPLTREELKKTFIEFKSKHPKRKIISHPLFHLPRSLWEYLTSVIPSLKDKTWGDLTRENNDNLLDLITGQNLRVNGKGIFKEEFVTAGGISRGEIDFRTMESKLHKGLYAVGEVLDIDGITGGFNFQNAWTGGYLAAKAIVQAFKSP
jgi:predicted Rossmann fold flavoprotein